MQNKMIEPTTKMYAKFKGNHTFKFMGKVQAVIPNGTVCEISKIAADKKVITVKYEDPTDNKTKYLDACLNCHGDKIDIFEEE